MPSPAMMQSDNRLASSQLASKLEDFNLRLEATGRPRTMPSRHPVLSDVITLPSAAPCQSRPDGELKHSNR